MLIAVGGHSRKAGKTSVIAGLIRALPDAEWTAVKITPHAHGAGERPATDTARYLAAGAHRSLLLQAAAPSEIREVLDSARNAIVESNRVLDFIEPDLFLMVLDFSVADFKESARKHMGRADAFVIVESAAATPSWPGVPADSIGSRPSFLVKPPEYTTPALVEFIRQRWAGARPASWQLR